MSEPEYHEKPVETGSQDYTKEKDHGGSPVVYEGEGVVPERKLKRQLKNRHVAMIRYVILALMLVSRSLLSLCCTVSEGYALLALVVEL
jgi:hypothetical protein